VNPTLIESSIIMLSFFKTRTVSSILSSFATTLAELEAHAEERTVAREERLAAAEAARKEAAEHDAEVVAATNVATKLRALIG
jgi:hypothetical protein